MASLLILKISHYFPFLDSATVFSPKTISVSLNYWSRSHWRLLLFLRVVIPSPLPTQLLKYLCRRRGHASAVNAEMSPLIEKHRGSLPSLDVSMTTVSNENNADAEHFCSLRMAEKQGAFLSFPPVYILRRQLEDIRQSPSDTAMVNQIPNCCAAFYTD